MFGFHGWLHLVTSASLAMVLYEYLSLRTIVQMEHKVKLWHSAPLPEPPTSKSIEEDLPPPEFMTGNILNVMDTEFTDTVAKKVEAEGTSVWCQGDKHINRLCRFKNICYLPVYDEFVFFHHNNSIFHQLPKNRFDPALLDWSSVSDHNSFYFNYVDMPVEKANLLLNGATFVKDTALVFKRFLPDNVMHVFHDDLLPMFYSIQLITAQNSLVAKKSAFDAQILFMDDYNPGVYSGLYDLFSNKRVMYKNEMQPPKTPVCFRDSYFGISKETTWYDYGFHEPQHPISGFNVTGRYILQFTAFVRNRLGISSQKSASAKPNIVLFSRKYTRIVTNENDLVMAFVQRLGLKVTKVSIEDMTVKEIIEKVSEASIAIGIHGSLMSFVMFLPPGSLVIELFPYAINPDNYTPYKTLSDLPGMGLTYKTWRNIDISKTVTHPERSWKEGGISHLPPEMQTKFKNAVEVQKHICCSDPEFLFRIYQDTEVNVADVIDIASNFMYDTKVKEKVDFSYVLQSNLLFPAEIKNANCKKNQKQGLSVAWLPPWNIPYLQYQNMKYEVVLEERSPQIRQSVFVRTTTKIFENIDPSKDFTIWIRCVLDKAVGPFNTQEIKCM